MALVVYTNKEVETGSKIIISQGKRFESVGIVFSFLALILLGVLSIFSYWLVILFSLMIFVLIFIVTNTTGVKIDLNSDKIEVYSKSLFSYNGDEKEFSKYESLAILTTKKGANLYSYRFNSEVVSGVATYKTSDVYFMDKNHRRRIYLKSFTDYNKAKDFARELSNKTGKPLLKYSPKRITKRRRR